MHPRDPVDIVLIEDDEADVIGFRLALKVLNSPHRLHVAHSAVEGLALIEQLAQTADIEQLVALIDVNLPGFSGLELLDRIRSNELLANLLVFVWSASDSPDDQRRAADLDVSGYLVKQDGLATFANAAAMLQNSRMFART